MAQQVPNVQTKGNKLADNYGHFSPRGEREDEQAVMGNK